MKIPSRLALLFCVVACASVSATAQSTSQAPANMSFGQSPANDVANELGLVNKSLQTLNSRLQAISEELLNPEKKEDDNSGERLKKISTNFDLLMHAEERAEVLRKQLIDLVEKETSYKIRMSQIDEDMQPQNIAQSMAGIGTTRTSEIRDTRRRSLENEKRGTESLLMITSQSRMRLEEDVRQADQLVSKLRQRLFPLIDREIDKLSPN